jgi:NAD(P)H dehydrogenase (quinone)
MILITGAAGKTGKAVIRKLAEKESLVKALVFRPEQVHEIETLGVKEVIVGDMCKSNFIQKAIQGVNSVYHICPNMHPDEFAIGKQLIDEAKAVGITHFVYHSVLHPQIELMPHHWNKMRVEELLFECGLPYTILQPAVYMQNILVNLGSILETGRYTVPYAVESRISMVDLEDVAQVAVVVLTEVNNHGNQPLHAGATYELVGTRPMSQTEVATILSHHLDRPVIAEQMSIDAWERRARSSGLSEYQVKTLIKMFAYYEKYGFWGNSHVLSWLLNRPTTSYAAFLKRVVKDRLHLVQ